ncbi:MAG: hypothetical protein QG567_479 [Campylobacterota bacterium]|nr:hypothetical protein [Campylobacterota bacterium]
MIKTATLAAVYESQGLKDDALKIYEELLKKDPQNKEARIAVKRLKGIKEKYSGVNKEMLDFFIQMNTEIEYAEFERWLIFE